MAKQRISAPVRLRFVLGDSAADLALPGEVPLIELLASVLVQLAPEAADHGADHDGWVIQRLGGPPLEEERTATDLNLLDGETLYLRPRADQLPPIDFDDLVDGVGEQARTSPHRWTDARSRTMLIVLSGALFGAGLVLLGSGGMASARSAVAGMLAVVLLAGGGLTARALPDPQIGTLLAGLGAAYAGLAGWQGAAALAPTSAVAVRLCLAVFAVLVALAAGLAGVADSGLLFAGAFAFAGNLVLPALLAATGVVVPQHAAALGLAATLMVSLFLPPAAFRLGGLALPLLPSKAEELSEDIDPAGYRIVVERGAAGIAYLAALSVGLACAQILLILALVAPGGTWPLTLAVVTGVLMFMRARHLAGMVTRWATMAPAAGLLLAGLVRFGNDQVDLVRSAVVVPAAAAVAGAVLAAAATLPGRRLRPYWGRAVDILEILIAISLVPVIAAVLGIYQMIRAWAS